MKSASEPLEGTASPPDLSVMPPLEPAARIADLEHTIANQGALIEALHASKSRLAADLAKLEKNPLLLALNVVDGGHVLEDAGDQLKSLSALVIERQEKGVLLLKLALKPFKADALVISATVQVTEPKLEPQQAVFYADADGELSRQDPRQRELALDR